LAKRRSVAWNEKWKKLESVMMRSKRVLLKNKKGCVDGDDGALPGGSNNLRLRVGNVDG